MSVSTEEQLVARAGEVAQPRSEVAQPREFVRRAGSQSKALRLIGVVGGVAGISALCSWMLVKAGIIGAAYDYVVSVSSNAVGNRPVYVGLNIFVPLAIGVIIAGVIAFIEKTTGVEIKGGEH